MSRANPASAESFAGGDADADAPNVEKRPIANASPPIARQASTMRTQRRGAGAAGASWLIAGYCLPGASSAPEQDAFGSGAFWLRQYVVRNSDTRGSSAESSFSWAFHALITIGESRPS